MLPAITLPYYVGFVSELFLSAGLALTLYYNYLCYQLYNFKRDKFEIKSLDKTISCFAGESCFLFASPYLSSSPLCKVDLGSSLDVIRIWKNDKGQRWIQVRKSYDNPFYLNSLKPQRGWIHV